jgi:hypothetical protein
LEPENSTPGLGWGFSIPVHFSGQNRQIAFLQQGGSQQGSQSVEISLFMG